MGYFQAGFDVVGVDVKPQPRYPFEFIQADAMEYLRGDLSRYDAIHASPPCQFGTALRHRWGKEYPNLIPEVRHLVARTGKPYVIENVETAGRHLANPLLLCGTMFDLRVIRHRMFENNLGLIFPPFSCRCRGLVGKHGVMGTREYMTVTGHFSNMQKASHAMGIDWMNQAELAQAIPPAYTHFIGLELMKHIEALAHG